MDAEDIARIERDHRPVVTCHGGTVGLACTCGAAWPCRVVMLADHARQRAARTLAASS
jgi:hypothetical protein